MNAFETGMAKLLQAQLAELYYCENELGAALETMAGAVRSDALRDLLRAHRGETLVQERKLETLFAELGVEPRPQHCRAIEGLLAAGQGKQDALRNDPALDLAVIAQAEKVELFEIASYMNLIRLARLLGKTNIVAVCSGILQEEQKALDDLTALMEEQFVEHGR